MILEHCGHYSKALSYASRALEQFTEPVKCFQVLNLLANIHLGKKDNKSANKRICEALSKSESMTPKLVRAGLITRAKVEVAESRKDAAVASYEQARLAEPDEPLPGDVLKAQFNACLDQREDTKLVEMFKAWKPMERLAWMTWDYSETGYDDHESLRRAVARSGQQEYLFHAYEETIKLLDNLDAAAPIRYQLAGTYWTVSGNFEAAKVLMNETLDTSSSGYPFALTNEDPTYTLVCAILEISEIIYEQFRTTSDPMIKAQLYTEIRGLMNRNLAQSVASLKSELAHHSLTIARMARKMAPAHEFQQIIESSFNLCYEALTDKVGWNDMLNLCELAALISNPEGLETEARILVSAQFSKLDPAVKDDYSESDSDDDEQDNGTDQSGDDEDAQDTSKTADEDEEDTDENSQQTEDNEEEEDENEDDEDGDPLPTDEGDLSDVWSTCDGECWPAKVWRAWKGQPMYVCITCCNTCLCEDCYNKRQEYNRQGGDAACRASVGSMYCGTNHRYIRGPIPGWKGITDGIMTIEGENGEEMIKVKFTDWLDELKNVKWKEAWEKFWIKED